MSLVAPIPSHLHRGVDAEKAARIYLEERGLRLLAQNFRCTAGELDLVMLDSNELVFVEVRYRKSEKFGGAAPSVDFVKRKKLRHAGETFLQENPRLRFDACRFDVVALTGGDSTYQIEWISDAF